MKLKDKIEDLKYELRFINFDAKVCLVGIELCVVLMCLYLGCMLVEKLIGMLV